jgi:hypothetical protein
MLGFLFYDLIITVLATNLSCAFLVRLIVYRLFSIFIVISEDLMINQRFFLLQLRGK